MNIVTWTFQVDYYAKGGYYMILGQDLLTELGLNPKFSEHVIEADDGPFNGSATTLVDLVTYRFKYLNTGKLHLNNHFIMLTLKNYMSQSMHILIQNYCV